MAYLLAAMEDRTAPIPWTLGRWFTEGGTPRPVEHTGEDAGEDGGDMQEHGRESNSEGTT